MTSAKSADDVPQIHSSPSVWWCIAQNGSLCLGSVRSRRCHPMRSWNFSNAWIVLDIVRSQSVFVYPSLPMTLPMNQSIPSDVIPQPRGIRQTGSTKHVVEPKVSRGPMPAWPGYRAERSTRAHLPPLLVALSSFSSFCRTCTTPPWAGRCRGSGTSW